MIAIELHQCCTEIKVLVSIHHQIIQFESFNVYMLTINFLNWMT